MVFSLFGVVLGERTCFVSFPGLKEEITIASQMVEHKIFIHSKFSK